MKNQIKNDLIALLNRGWAWLPKRSKIPLLIAILLIIAWWFIKDFIPQPPPPVVSPPEVIVEQPKGLQNGGFEKGLEHWEPVYKQEDLSASSDQVTFYQGYSYNISTSIRRTGQKSLYINNSNTKAFSNKTGIKFMRKQSISGLKPNAQYRLTYYVKGLLDSQDSLWFKLSSTSWLPAYDGDRYYTDAKENYADWRPQESIIDTGDWTEGYLWLISEDVCELRLDDISFVEITEQ